MDILSFINDKLWLFTTLLIFLFGLYFSFKLKWIQFNIIKMISSLLKKDNCNEGVTSFKTLMLSLAGRIGVGSISGVALAIYLGGPGTVFWIWVISFISASIAYSEAYLAVKYKVRTVDGFIGGPSYYIKRGINKLFLGGVYSIIITLCYVIGFIGIQANTITKSFNGLLFNVSPYLIGSIISILTLFIIFEGIKKITETTSKIVPIMSIFYIVLSLYITLSNIGIFPNIIKSIFTSAFNFKSFSSGFLVTLLIGVQRGIFSNEAGIGTGAIASASSSSDDANKQGYIQIIGVYITSIIICTCTAFIILSSSYKGLNVIDPNGIEIATFSFNYHLGKFGNIFLLISIFLFAFSTILSGYFYGESSLKYFFNNINNKYIFILKLFTTIVIFTGSIISSTFLWNFIDILVSILAIINIYAIYKLRNEIKR